MIAPQELQALYNSVIMYLLIRGGKKYQPLEKFDGEHIDKLDYLRVERKDNIKHLLSLLEAATDKEKDTVIAELHAWKEKIITGRRKRSELRNQVTFALCVISPMYAHQHYKKELTKEQEKAFLKTVDRSQSNSPTPQYSHEDAEDLRRKYNELVAHVAQLVTKNKEQKRKISELQHDIAQRNSTANQMPPEFMRQFEVLTKTIAELTKTLEHERQLRIQQDERIALLQGKPVKAHFLTDESQDEAGSFSTRSGDVYLGPKRAAP